MNTDCEDIKYKELTDKIIKIFVTVQHPHLTSPIKGEETFFPAPGGRG